MYFIRQILTIKGLRHGISTVSDGNMDFRFEENKEQVKKNRKNFFNNLSIPPERSVFLNVQHGIKIINANHSLAGTGFNSSESAIKADALITQEKNLALVVLTADCIPAIIFDDEKSMICLAHISRHNTKLAFPQVLTAYIKREYGIDPKKLNVFFGPAIQKDSYVLPQFQRGFDLIGESISQFILRGVRRENIVADINDTAINPEFFSHYRDVRSKTPEGRFVTTIMLT